MPTERKSGDPRLRLVPSIDELLRTEPATELRATIGVKRITALARLVTAEIRAAIKSSGEEGDAFTAEALLETAARRLQEISTLESRNGIRNVINATGVILHTNLGRAPLSKAAQAAINEEAARYCSLEYDSATGLRGKRGARVEALLRDLTGAEDALVVNNCAAAALLVLGVIAGDGETLVSRGELVEIGGDFRVPDVMASSGTRMIEIGTTNKTHLDDYRKAISAKTRLIMRVHPSNYRVVGFVSSPSLEELTSLAREAMIPLYEDAGSGQLSDLKGIEGEPVIRDLISAGADLVSFSGDKLLGSVQAGMIVGRRGIINRLRRHPLYRALRSDKIRLAALEATLLAHQKGTQEEEIPVIQMLAIPASQIEDRASSLISKVTNTSLVLEVTDAESAIGGGAGPNANLPTRVIAVSHETLSAQELENALRSAVPPVVARIAEQKVLLDLRTVFADQEPLLVNALNNLK